MRIYRLCFWSLLTVIMLVAAQQPALAAGLSSAAQADFQRIYGPGFPSQSVCEQSDTEFRLCSPLLLNDFIGPRVLLSQRDDGQPAAVIVLFHGLSDSPFYLLSIAKTIQQAGYDLILPLHPAHGLKAPEAMHSSDLKQQWRDHVDAVMKFAQGHWAQVHVGGFSTGGALSVDYLLRHDPSTKPPVSSLLLFSGALALDDKVESWSKVPFIKQVAKIIDGEYQGVGKNPYKYPSVSGYAGMVLMELIREIRATLNEQVLRVPIFAAHSAADTTTPLAGIDDLLARVEGDHTRFVVGEEIELCHSDVVLDPYHALMASRQYVRTSQDERCTVPQANPQFNMMVTLLKQFLSDKASD